MYLNESSKATICKCYKSTAKKKEIYDRVTAIAQNVHEKIIIIWSTLHSDPLHSRTKEWYFLPLRTQKQIPEKPLWSIIFSKKGNTPN